AALGIAGLVLDDLPAVLDEDRLLDVFMQEPRVVPTPGADHDLALALRTARARPAGNARCRQRRRSGDDAPARQGGSSVIAHCHLLARLPPPHGPAPANTMPLAASQPTCTASPTRGTSLPARLGTCTTTRSFAEMRTCRSTVAPR